MAASDCSQQLLVLPKDLTTETFLGNRRLMGSHTQPVQIPQRQFNAQLSMALHFQTLFIHSQRYLNMLSMAPPAVQITKILSTMHDITHSLLVPPKDQKRTPTEQITAIPYSLIK